MDNPISEKDGNDDESPAGPQPNGASLPPDSSTASAFVCLMRGPPSEPQSVPQSEPQSEPQPAERQPKLEREHEPQSVPQSVPQPELRSILKLPNAQSTKKSVVIECPSVFVRAARDGAAVPSHPRYNMPPTQIVERRAQPYVRFRQMEDVRIRAGLESAASSESLRENSSQGKQSKRVVIIQWVRRIILISLWLTFFWLLVLFDTNELETHLISVPPGTGRVFPVPYSDDRPTMGLKLSGYFVIEPYDFPQRALQRFQQGNVRVVVQRVDIAENGARTVTAVSEEWSLPTINPRHDDNRPTIERDHIFKVNAPSPESAASSSHAYQLFFSSDFPENIPLQVSYWEYPIEDRSGLFYGILILVPFFILIIFDVVHRAFAGMLGASFSIGIMALLHARPSLHSIFSWINMPVLMMLFGMSVVASKAAKSGFLDYMAVQAYQFSNGHIWPILNVLWLVILGSSLIFDNITVIMLFSPVVIRLSEIMQLNPAPLLILLMITANITSTFLPYVDGPDVVIMRHHYISDNIADITFIVHIVPGVLLALAQSYLHMRIMFNDSNRMRYMEQPEIERLHRLVKVLKRTATNINPLSKDEKELRTVVQTKVRRVSRRLRRLGRLPEPAENFESILRVLKGKYPIKDRWLLLYCGVTIAFAVVMYLLIAILDLRHISFGWIAILCALLLVILDNKHDWEAIISQQDWTTMIFFATLSVISQSLQEVRFFQGLSTWIGDLLHSFNASSQLAISMMLVLWISAFLSTLLGCLSSATLMLKVTIFLAVANDNLPLQPLIWALTLGAAFGANGTNIGAVSNVICVGVAERHGYTFTFLRFLRVGMPIMIGNCVISSLYLIIAHIAFNWH